MSKAAKLFNARAAKGATIHSVNKRVVAMELKYLLTNIGRCRLTHIKLLSRLREDLGIDSFNVTEILVAIEQRYGLKIPEDEANGIITFKDLVRLISKKLKKNT